MNAQPNNKYNTETGELIGSSVVINQPRPITKPNLANARQLEGIAGKQAQYINLKDHPEMNGQKVAIVRVVQGSGEFGDYLKIHLFPIDSEGNAGPLTVVMTGAENVVDRANSIAGDCSLDSPVIATFESVGDAWLLN